MAFFQSLGIAKFWNINMKIMIEEEFSFDLP